LFLQWTVPFPIEDFDDLVALEDLLIEELADGGEVDGHDVGSDEVNLFIHTDSPRETFNALQPILKSRTLLHHTRAAIGTWTKANTRSCGLLV
jgi:hypothetical protein